MELLEQEMEAEVFVWETSAEAVVETVEESSEVIATALRSAALEALDALEETAPAEEFEPQTFTALDVEVESGDADAQTVIEPSSAAEPIAVETTTVNADAPEVPQAPEVLEDATNPDADYVAHCMALLHEVYPDGLAGLFANGVAEGLFTILWGKGPISGAEEWTHVDNMLMDAVFITLQSEGLDLAELWENFTGDLVEKLFPDGFAAENLFTALNQNGPISGEAEWTELDFQAFDLLKSLVWAEDFDGDWENGSLEIFNDAFPGGIDELFPDGYSDEAFDALLDGKGLYSGEAEWTEEDLMLFEGLWQALQASGIEAFEGDEDFEPLPIVVICDFLPPPEPVVCLPREDMISI